MGSFALSVGVPALAGPFILAAAAYLLAGLFLFAFLRPDPFIIARKISELRQASQTGPAPEPFQSNKRLIITGAFIMIMTQIVMVAVMTMTPVHMGDYGHTLGAIGFVIGLHIAAMYLPSPLTGILVDKVGRYAMAVAAGVTLLAAGVVAATASGESFLMMNVALILLGLGWNFGYIGATAMLTRAHAPEERERVQGINDFFVFGGVFLASLSSGGLLNCLGGSAQAGWNAVNMAMLPFLVLAGGALIWLTMRPRAA